MLTTAELRQKWFAFFKSKNHAIIPSASLIPTNDPTVLFTTAGMHPLVPYLRGEKHPKGTRLANVQKCVRTGDIDDVGDATHCTFFEMLGNWSLGDYFKKESIAYSFEFLTSVLGLKIENLAVTVFSGDEDAPRDDFSANEWLSHGIPKNRIFYLPKEHNWWWAGEVGPCGPDTEIFVVRDQPDCGEACGPACRCGKYVEIWNNVFMEFERKADGKCVPLSQKNVDTGMGLERTVAMLNGYKSVYETDVFAPIMEHIASKTPADKSAPETVRAMRVIADHIRSATFMLGDENGILPGNLGQSYVLRRLIRRAIRFARQLELDFSILTEISALYVAEYASIYPELKANSAKVQAELNAEIERFSATLQKGMAEFEKLTKYVQGGRISGKAAFRLYDTFGFPIEMTQELAKDANLTVDMDGYAMCLREHQEKARADAAENKFKGGLADASDETTKLHTATHLLLASLKKILGDEAIQQKGSNITQERLRFDFNFPRPLTDPEIRGIEAEVNRAILASVPVVCREMSLEAARAENATGVFGSKYAETVKVYSIEGFSKEICGGPHAGNTKDLGRFEIQKEQSSSAGIRRIKGVLHQN